MLVTDDKTEFRYIVGVIDAIYQTKRKLTAGPKAREVSAFNVAFATD